MNPILLQTMYYGIVMAITFMFLEFLTQGFLHKFLIVFGSLGRKSFVKIRLATYDAIAIGKEDEGFLVFKFHSQNYRIPITKDKKYFYRFLFCQWVDLDGEKWALCLADYTTVSSYDPVKIQNFLKRILMAPKADDTTTRIIIILLVVAVVAIIGLFIFDVTLMNKINALQNTLNTIVTQTTPTVKSATI